MKRLTLFLILSFGVPCAWAQEAADTAAYAAAVGEEPAAEAASPEQLWDRANTAYVNGDYHAAAEIYEGILAQGSDDIRYNLSVAEARTKDNIEQIPEFFLTEWMRGVRHTMSCTAWSILSLAALVCALALFLTYLLAQRLPLRKTGFYGTLVAAAAFMLTSWFAVGERREMLDDTQAVVMSLSTAVKSSPDKSATDLFVLHEGTLVEITDRLDNWCEITIADGKKGWLECKTIETI